MDAEVGTGQRNFTVPQNLQFSSSESKLQAHAIVGISHQSVGQAQGKGIHRTAWTDAEALVTVTSQILQRREKSRFENAKHRLGHDAPT